jgi:SWI/SNF-related matrix-associated actin-dependent regulator 1 of chromatin subfamily A
MPPKSSFAVEASRAVKPYFYHAPAPPQMHAKEYQHAAVEYALARDNCLLGDAPGLGKTAEAILISNAIEAKSTLVICPASLRLNWEREIWRWSMLPNVYTQAVMKAKDGVDLKANYLILSYDILRNESILDAILDKRWDHMILDEAHYLKDPKGNKRTRAICAPDCLPSVVGRITMATGTPLPNQPIECYNAVRLLNWDALDRMSLEQFRARYYDFGSGMVRRRVLDRKSQAWVSKLQYSSQVRNVPKNLDDLQYRLRKHVMIRRLKEQVLKELPAKQWHPFPIALTPEMRAALKHPGWTAAERLYEMDAQSFDAGIPIDGEISTARRLLGEAKAPAVAAYIDDLLESGVEKVIVSAWHHTVLEFLRERLKRYGLVFMDGTLSTPRRQAIVDQFQTDPRIKIILGQTIPLGVGWTLTAAQDAVLAEPDWVPGQNDQFLDRLHRLGQKGDYVIGHIPVLPGTLDERILATAIAKDQNIYRALDAA